MKASLTPFSSPQITFAGVDFSAPLEPKPSMIMPWGSCISGMSENSFFP